MPVIEVTEIEAGWEQFYQIIHIQFPHSEVINVKIRGGVITLPDFLDNTVLLAREAALGGRSAPEVWDDRWVRLLKFCREMRNVDLLEIQFRDGIPQFFRARNYMIRQDEGAPTWSSAPPDFRQMTTKA